jgi:outer membrane usher protein
VSYGAQIAKPASPEPGGYGWRIGAERGANEREYASGSYRGQGGRIEAGVQRSDSGIAASASLDGAVVLADWDLFITNRIEDAFAIVDAGVAGVEVRRQNRAVGKTGRRGNILVPNLASYRSSRIDIDQDSLPLGAAIPTTSETVIPRELSGVVVNFGVEEDAAAALVTFRDEAGTYLPVGLEAQLIGGGAFVIGYDGQAYMAGLTSANQVVVDLGDGRSCRAQFTYRPHPDGQNPTEDVLCN